MAYLNIIAGILAPIISYILYNASMREPYIDTYCSLFGYNCNKTIPFHGFFEDEYKPVLDIFIDNLKTGREIGAGFTVYVDGKQVISAQGGWQDTEQKIEYTNDTLQMVFSCTKTLSAIVIAQLVDKDLLDYDEKISAYWPEFAQGKKENVTLMDLMRHTAGIGALDSPLSLSDVTNSTVFSHILASQPHNWDGERKRSYAAISQGWYQNEIIRRVDPNSRTIDDFAREFKEKYGVEWYLKPDATKGVDLSRIALFYGSPTWLRILSVLKAMKNPRTRRNILGGLIDKKSLFTRTIRNCIIDQARGMLNRDPKYRAIEGPSYSGHTNADSIAKLAAMMANHGKAIVPGEPNLFKNEETYIEATKFIDYAPDVFLSEKFFNSRGGFLVLPNEAFFNVSDTSTDGLFEGGIGAGGSMFLFNRKYDIGLGYTTNGYQENPRDPRTLPMIKTLFEIVKDKKEEMASKIS